MSKVEDDAVLTPTSAAVKKLTTKVVEGVLERARRANEAADSPAPSTPSQVPTTPPASPPVSPPAFADALKAVDAVAPTGMPAHVADALVGTRFILDGRSGVVWNRRKLSGAEELVGLAFDDAASVSPSWKTLSVADFMQQACPWTGQETGS